MRVGKRGGKENLQAFFRQSMEFRRSEFIETRNKVHLLDEGYVHILKMGNFTEDPKGGDFGKSKISV